MDPKAARINFFKLLQEHEEAEKLCTEWLYRNPNDVDFRLKRANLYQVKDKHDLAEGDYLILRQWLISAHASFFTRLSQFNET